MGQKLSREEVLEIVRVAREKGERPDLREMVFFGMRLSRMNLSRVDLSGADLTGVDLFEADISKADLSRANLVGANLSRANLSRAILNEASLRGASLFETNLSTARLSGAILVGANLSKADLSGADLSGANLSEANFSEARLSGAILFRANLNKTNLLGVDLGEATIGQTIFGDVDLSGAKRLEQIQHLTPSMIGVETLFRSKGQIPEVFLRGVGVPVDLISYLEKIRTPECGYTLEQLDEYIESGQKYLTTIHRSLHFLTEKKAKYGLDVPLSIEHQILDYETEQAKAEERLAEYQRLRTLYYPSGRR